MKDYKKLPQIIESIVEQVKVKTVSNFYLSVFFVTRYYIGIESKKYHPECFLNLTQ